MDVDDVAFGKLGRTETVAEDLHVAGEDHRVDAVFLEEGDLRLLLSRLVLLGDGEVVEGDAEALGRAPQVLAVADDQRDLDIQFTRLAAGQEVVEAMPGPGSEDGHARAPVAVEQLPAHVERGGEVRLEDRGELRVAEPEAVELPLDTHEEHPALRIDVLGEVEDVPAVAPDELGDGRHKAWLVGAGDQEGRGARCAAGHCSEKP